VCYPAAADSDEEITGNHFSLLSDSLIAAVVIRSTHFTGSTDNATRVVNRSTILFFPSHSLDLDVRFHFWQTEQFFSSIYFVHLLYSHHLYRGFEC
jgi:hypothetical protein